MPLQFGKNHGLGTSQSLALAVLAMNMTFSTPIFGETIELSELGTVHPGFQINGIDEDDRSGVSVSGAGDVNGDGLADLIVGGYRADPSGENSGETYVVFGKTDSSAVELSALANGGFQITGIDARDYSGRSVSGAGDVNGDGLADLIVGAPSADHNGMDNTGESYVIFGKTTSTLVELSALGAGGFQITGIDAGDSSATSVSGAGDVNGDGLADLIVGASFADPNGRVRAGESYVIFGKNNSTLVELSALGTGGFQINGIDVRDYSGGSVSGAGDVNGDGLADLIVGGAWRADPVGEIYVVFGKNNSTPVELSALGTGGFQINGVDQFDRAGLSVSGAGDVNGDGLADLIIGAWRTIPEERRSAGESYVIFGKNDSTLVELSDLGTRGFQINGIDQFDRSGISVSGAGDTNGDGLADLIVGANYAAPNGISDAGESYVIFGKTNSTLVELSALGTGGILLNGIGTSDRSGFSVSGAGDVNGDGLADLIVGAMFANPIGGNNNGESYVVFSPSTPPASATYRASALGGDAPRVAIGITGDGSNVSTPDSRTWIDFADGGTTASLQTVTLTRSNDSISNLSVTANVLWEVSTNRTEWSSANVTFKYTDAEIKGITENTLKLFQASSPAGPWSELPGATITETRNQISADVSSLGYFALFGIDNVKPTSTAVQAFAEIETPSTELVIRFNRADADSGVATVELFYRFNGGNYVSAGSTTNPEFIRIDTATLNGEGTYDFYTVATDIAGNVEEAPATPDITIETVIINSVWVVK